MIAKNIGRNIYIYISFSRYRANRDELWKWCSNNDAEIFLNIVNLPNDQTEMIRLKFGSREARAKFIFMFTDKLVHTPVPYTQVCDKKAKRFQRHNENYSLKVGDKIFKYSSSKNHAGWYLAWVVTDRTLKADPANFASRRRKLAKAWFWREVNREREKLKARKEQAKIKTTKTKAK